MTNNTLSHPAVYVGTYAKYNNGSIAGKWLNLDDYADSKEFYEACRELHKNESDPEFMFQDWENIPDEYICESGIDSKYWDFLEFIENTHLPEGAVQAGIDAGIPLDSIEGAYYGEFSSNTDLAYDYVENTGVLSEVPESLQYYFDYESFSRDLAMDFIESDGFYFYANY